MTASGDAGDDPHDLGDPHERGDPHEAGDPHEEYVESVLSAVERIEEGRVSSYGDIAQLVGRGGPRQVGQIMSRYGAAVPWWRVVRADGRPAAGLEEAALARLRAENVPLIGDRVDMRRARNRRPQEDW